MRAETARDRVARLRRGGGARGRRGRRVLRRLRRRSTTAGGGENRGYFEQLELVYRFLVPPGASVLEIGCGERRPAGRAAPGGRPRRRRQRAAWSSSRARAIRGSSSSQASGERLDAGRTFDYIVLSDLVPFVARPGRAVREPAAPLAPAHAGHRQLPQPALAAGAPPRRAPPPEGAQAGANWVSPDDIRNVLELAGLRAGDARRRRILLPKRVPLLSTFLNGFVANIWPFNHLCLTYWIVARPAQRAGGGAERLGRLPLPERGGKHRARRSSGCRRWARARSSIFVEGGSTDGTRAEIERQIAAHPGRGASRSSLQTGKGKGDAVRAGFAVARNEVLMILDGDLTVAPEDLPKFYRALVDRRAELVNGSRLVYDLEKGSMRFLNMLGQPALLGALPPDRRPAREGHALRDEGAPPRRLRADRGRPRLLRRLRPVRRLRPAASARASCRSGSPTSPSATTPARTERRTSAASATGSCSCA